jgi:hypothetical protein
MRQATISLWLSPCVHHREGLVLESSVGSDLGAEPVRRGEAAGSLERGKFDLCQCQRCQIAREYIEIKDFASWQPDSNPLQSRVAPPSSSSPIVSI